MLFPKKIEYKIILIKNTSIVNGPEQKFILAWGEKNYRKSVYFHSSTKWHPVSPLNCLTPGSGPCRVGDEWNSQHSAFCISALVGGWELLPVEKRSEFTSPADCLRAHPQEVQVGSEFASCLWLQRREHEDTRPAVSVGSFIWCAGGWLMLAVHKICVGIKFCFFIKSPTCPTCIRSLCGH